jgi:MFS family permease
MSLLTDVGADMMSVGEGRRTRASRRFGFWAVGFALLALTAFSTAPSPLYGLYQQRDNLSSLTVTAVYAVYAAGILVSLLLVGHVSDWYGRRTVLIPALSIALLAGVLFCLWKSLPNLLVARFLTGLALGATLTAATAYLGDVDVGVEGTPSRKSQVVATVANVGGLATGPLIAGLLAQYLGYRLTLPYVVFAIALAVALAGVLFAPETRASAGSPPRYHPQRLGLPATHRAEFIAATLGIFLCFAVAGLFAGLAGVFLAGPLHQPSHALVGVTIFVNFGAACVVQITTSKWTVPRLLTLGVVLTLAGLAVLVFSTWITPPSLGLFLGGGAIVGGGSGAIFRGTLTMTVSASATNERASALASFFVAGYLGLSLPVVALGIVLQKISPKVTLLAFALVVGLAMLAAAPVLTARNRGTKEGESQ